MGVGRGKGRVMSDAWAGASAQGLIVARGRGCGARGDDVGCVHSDAGRRGGVLSVAGCSEHVTRNPASLVVQLWKLEIGP